MSLSLTVDHLGDSQFEIRARNHTIICDQPLDNGGYDEGMTPPELMLASLGSCAGYYAAEYLRRHKLSGSGTQVRIVAEKAKNPARIGEFLIDVHVPAELDEKHREGITAAIRKCIIHNTLTHPPTISLQINSMPLAEKVA